MKVGFIGIGIMGFPMALNMLRKGTALMINDIDSSRVQLLEKEGAASATLFEIGEKCDVIFTILPTGKIVQDVLFGENSVSKALKKGAIVVDMSSVTPVESRFCAEKLSEIGAEFLDAPVSGGEPKAIDGTLSFMVGGKEEIFEKMKPLMLQMGASAVLVGGYGSGSITKLANQIIVNMNIAVLGEALVFATKAGVDPEKVCAAISGGLAGSAVMNAKAHMMINRDFAPGGKISINHKDISNVITTAHALDIPVQLTAQLFEILQGLKIRGMMDEDHSAIVKHFERLADVEVGK